MGEKKDELELKLRKIQDLRYGENPHQKAVFYEILGEGDTIKITDALQLQGKELSFNNILDLDSALQIALEFEEPTAVIIKHNNPCGVAEDKDLKVAFENAYNCDPLSAFGGIIGLNRRVEEETASAILKAGFMEAIIAPSYSEDALQLFSTKKNFRVLELPTWEVSNKGHIIGGLDFKKVSGGMLIQDKDIKRINKEDLKVVTKREPTKDELDSLLFAWKVVKNIKSNAIVLAQGKRTMGIGAGQMSRVDSVLIAIRKAGIDKHPSPVVMASDAFFPKRDSVDYAAKAGVTAIIQPGGSIRDEESIMACDENNIAMVFTGIRHFKH